MLERGIRMADIRSEDLNKITKRTIYELIQKMDLEESTKLPREEDISKQLGVSRITVRNALSQLETEGVIFRKHGKGTFVNAQAIKIKVKFSPIEDFRKVIINSGYAVDVSIERIIVRSANEKEAEKLQIKENAEIIIVEKMFFADSYPTIYCIDRIPLNMYKGQLNKASMLIPLSDFAKKSMGKKIVWDKVELLTTTSEETPFLKERFNCDNTKSFLNCNVVNFDENDEPIIYSNEYIDTNFIRFNMIRKKSGY